MGPGSPGTATLGALLPWALSAWKPSVWQRTDTSMGGSVAVPLDRVTGFSDCSLGHPCG